VVCQVFLSTGSGNENKQETVLTLQDN